MIIESTNFESQSLLKIQILMQNQRLAHLSNQKISSKGANVPRSRFLFGYADCTRSLTTDNDNNNYYYPIQLRAEIKMTF
jgi:hypothetical protein